MATTLRKEKAPKDWSKVSLNEPWEVTYWTEALHCTEQELRAAVEVIGHSVDELRMYLHD